MEATHGTAVKIVLNPRVQVVAPVIPQAFRQADMHTGIIGRASGVTRIGSRTLMTGVCPR
jgi:hypothetical protein